MFLKYLRLFKILEVSPREAADNAYRVFDRICALYEVHIVGANGTLCQHGVAYEMTEMVPEIPGHANDGEALELPCLSQCYHLEGFIEGPETARHDDEGA